MRLLLLLAGLACGTAAHALQVVTENDSAVTENDRHYTQGARIALEPREVTGQPWQGGLDRALLPLASGPRRAWLQWLVVGQQLYTPDDGDAVDEAEQAARPFAGWLYAGGAYFTVADDAYSRLELLLGVVGPSAGGEDLQNGFHKVFGFGREYDWSGQIGDTPVAVVTYERGQRVALLRRGAFRADLIGQLGLTAGNLFDHVHAAGLLRAGTLQALPYGSDTLRGGYAGLPRLAGDTDGFGRWALWGGVQARQVWRNALLTGFSAEDPDVRRVPFVRDVLLGAAVALPYRSLLSLYAVDRSEEFGGQRGNDRYGGVSIELRF